jgi:hypothetical protein
VKAGVAGVEAVAGATGAVGVWAKAAEDNRLKAVRVKVRARRMNSTFLKTWLEHGLRCGKKQV